MSVRLNEIMSAARARSASLAAEVAGYLVLAAADQVAGAPRALGFDDVALSEEGQVRVAGGRSAEDAAAEHGLREMLGVMLLEASSVTPGLLRAAHKASGAGVDGLIREIEVALVPVNRAAARRALARLHRDVARARESGRMAPWSAPVALATAPPAPPAPARVAPPPLPEAVHVAPPAPRAQTPEPSPAEIDLVAVLARESEPPAVADGERSWLTPESVAVMQVEWPVAAAPIDDDELRTAIPIFVEELRAETPVPALPMVPDLEVPESAPVPEVRRAHPEPVTVPAPLVAPGAAREASAGARTPPLGSTLPVHELGSPLERSEPTPGVLVLAGDDATERVPSVMDDRDEVDRALAEVTAAFAELCEPVEGLETRDPPVADDELVYADDEASGEWPPVMVTPSPVMVTPSPVMVTPSPVMATPSPVMATPSPVMATPSPRDVLTRLADRPERPTRHEYAPPRYAPKKSDVSELLSGFGVAAVRTDREVCSDLKALAGVDQTAPPPLVELSETPPPVAVGEVGPSAPASPRPREESNARVVAGAASVALIVAGVGLGSIPVRQSEPAAASRAPMSELGSSDSPAAPCTAELTVRQIPEHARTRVRRAADTTVLAPSRVVGSDAVFEGLECGQSAEVTVELPGRARWMRIPVAAEALSPSPEAPGLVRFAVALR
ncbi:MAG: hypothetical protein IT377_16205 [Polyangiaceae bacterium]|nr:hypothetical protein [Polyangiaceae bacterium]